MTKRMPCRHISLMCCLFLANCQAFNSELVDPMPVTQPSKPIQLSYRPFKTMRYHVAFKDKSGHTFQSMDYSISGERFAGNLVLTFQMIRVLNGGVSTIGDPNAWLKAVIDPDGEIRDFVSTTSRGKASADDPTGLDGARHLLDFTLPIYSKSPVSIGQVAAHTTSVTNENGRSYNTLVFAGMINHHGIQAVRLNFDRLKFEQTFKPSAHDVAALPGYIIIDPSNGVVLQMRRIGGSLETYETSVDII